jgi:hypothetical protein
MRIERLQGADRLAVITQFAMVVVLDYDGSAAARPGHAGAQVPSMQLAAKLPPAVLAPPASNQLRFRPS